MPYVLSQPARRESAPYGVFRDLFSPDDCAKIVAMAAGREARTATVGADHKGHLDRSRRSTEIYWINPNPENAWLFQRLGDAVCDANGRYWGYHLSGIVESLQLTHYKSAEQGHYSWHEDHAETGYQSNRKLSCVLPLNDGYEGGQFEIFGKGPLREMRRGTMIVFPSYKTHRVTPVTSGDRWSLVAWVSGPPFV